MRKMRSWSLVIAAVVGGAVGGLFTQALSGRAAFAAEGGAGTLRATTIILVDTDGREIGELGIREGGWGLMFRDVEGNERITLGYGTASDYYALRFVDAGGQGRFGCGAAGDGSSCGMTMKTAAGTERVGFGVGDGSAGLVLRNEFGMDVVGMRAGRQQGDLALMDPDTGRFTWRASQRVVPQPAAPPALP